MSILRVPKLQSSYWADLADVRGWAVLWHRGQRCPCWDIQTGWDYNCTTCSGDGFVLEEGIPTIVTVGNNTDRKKFQETGSTEEGDFTIAVSPVLWDRSKRPWRLRPNPAFDASADDVFVVTEEHAIMRQSILLEHGRLDRLRSYYPVRIVAVKLIRPGGAIDLVEGRDFELHDRDITFISAIRPDPDETYSVLYDYRPEYILRVALPAPHVTHNEQQPKNFTAILRDRPEG